MVKWSVALSMAMGPKSATVEQTQKAKLKNSLCALSWDQPSSTHPPTSHLTIESSGRSIGVPFADNFTAEERWEVVATDTGIRIVITAGVHWHSSPWGAAFIKGTIEDTSMKSTIANAGLFLDMALELIAERRKRGPTKVEPKQRKALGAISASTSSSTSTTTPVKKGPSKTVTHNASPAASSPEERPRGHSKVSLARSTPVPSALSPTTLKTVLYAVLALLLFTLPMLLHLANRLNALEAELAKRSIDEKIVERVAFLEYYLQHLHRNTTGDGTTVEQHFDKWKANGELLQHLNKWRKDLDELSRFLTVRLRRDCFASSHSS